jgi:hypothetical protein
LIALQLLSPPITKKERYAEIRCRHAFERLIMADASAMMSFRLRESLFH